MLMTGDVVLKKGRGITRVVGWFTDSKYTHVGLVYEREIIVHSHALGVHPWDIYDLEPYDLYRIKGGLSEEERSQFKEILLDEIKKNIKYDYGQLIAYGYYALFGGENKLNNPKHYICSELVDRVYKKLGYELVPGKLLGDVTPADLARSSLLEQAK